MERKGVEPVGLEEMRRAVDAFLVTAENIIDTLRGQEPSESNPEVNGAVIDVRALSKKIEESKEALRTYLEEPANPKPIAQVFLELHHVFQDSGGIPFALTQVNAGDGATHLEAFKENMKKLAAELEGLAGQIKIMYRFFQFREGTIAVELKRLGETVEIKNETFKTMLLDWDERLETVRGQTG